MLARRRPRVATLALSAVVLGFAALSLLAPSQPGYDAWSWLVWGREVAGLELDTVDGPAFKPLPVVVCAVLSIFGGAAPALWLVVARAGAIAAVLLAGRVAWRLSGGSRVAALAGAVGVALSTGWWWHGSVGNAEGLFLALALGALEAGLTGRLRAALALALGAALLRPESWPFVGLYAAWLWWREPLLRPLVAAALLAIPLLWLGPELLGSGDALRSSQRARIPNPGAPALAEHPALASLGRAASIAFVPVVLAALATVRTPRAWWPAAAGGAWVVLVALMAEGGYSGEPRYALPGVAAIAVSGGAGVGLLWSHAVSPRSAADPAAQAGRGKRVPWERHAGAAPRVAVAVAAVACALAFLPARLGSIHEQLARAGDDAALWGSLDDAVTRAGGRGVILACAATPVTGPYRGPAVAWALRVHKRQVRFGPSPRAVVLRSRIRPGRAIQPPAAGPLIARSARWEVRAPGASRCAGTGGGRG